VNLSDPRLEASAEQWDQVPGGSNMSQIHLDATKTSADRPGQSTKGRETRRLQRC